MALGLAQEPDFPHLEIEAPGSGAVGVSVQRCCDAIAAGAALVATGGAPGAAFATPLGARGMCAGRDHNRSSGADGPRRGGRPSDQRQCPSTSPAAQARARDPEGCSGRLWGHILRPKQILAAVGDPFQAFTAGVLLGAVSSGQPLLLGGGLPDAGCSGTWRCRLCPSVSGSAWQTRC